MAAPADTWTPCTHAQTRTRGMFFHAFMHTECATHTAKGSRVKTLIGSWQLPLQQASAACTATSPQQRFTCACGCGCTLKPVLAPAVSDVLFPNAVDTSEYQAGVVFAYASPSETCQLDYTNYCLRVCATIIKVISDSCPFVSTCHDC